jgi:hypothetical protein
MNDDEKPILDDDALAVWPAAEPPAGFADRVMAARARGPAPRRKLWWLGGAGVAAVAVAAAFFAWPRRALEKGTVSAGERTETRLGERATAVAEPGSSLRWTVEPGGDGAVFQERGDVFYRVERGGPFVVATPAGDVRVLGTCFRVEVTDMKIGKQGLAGAAVGAAVSAVVMVTVYEGRVLLANEKGRTELRAGEHATAASGAAPGPAVSGAATASPASGAAPAAATPAELVQREATQRAEIAKLRARLAELEGHGTAFFEEPVPPGPAPWHLHPSHDELVEMAKECKIRFDMPSMAATEPFAIPPQARAAAGLSDGEATAAEQAVAEAMARTQAQIRAIYVEVTGNSAAAEELSFDSMIREIEEKSGDEGAAKRQLSAERAGLAAVPATLADRSPGERLLRVLSGTGDDVERAVAGAIGPDRAHALRGADGWRSTWSMSGCPK